MKPRAYAPLWPLVLAGLLWTQAAQAQADPPATVARFALLAGANYGGLDRVRLKYAESDAQAMARVLTELGGVEPADQLVVIDPDPARLEAAFTRMAGMLEAAADRGARREFVFYYSGHSDESGLKLGGQHVPYTDLRKRVQALPADVRVAVLDSCASGAFTRTKGGVRRRPFLVDASTKVRGFAVLTSASDDEAAQESDRVGGSFFTHYLVSGLRGAADVSQDGKVTLAEAYQYAFDETLRRTEQTRVGPQHPNYDFHLAGAGELILTDLRGTAALLQLDPGLVGRLFIRDTRGRLVAEVNKVGGQPMSLGLEPGTYQLTLDTGEGLLAGSLALAAGARTRLELGALAAVAAEATTARGGPAASQARPGAAVEQRAAERVAYEDQFFALQFVPGVGTTAFADKPVRHHLSFNILAGYGAALDGLELGGLANVRTGPVRGLQLGGLFNTSDALSGMQLGGLFNIATGPVAGVQLGGVFNIAAGDFVGLGFGGVFNIASGVHHGAQISGVFNVARAVEGFQGSVINITWEDSRGWQGGVVNWSGDLVGAQTGVINATHGQVRGLQAGVVNYANRLDGVSLGLINVAPSMDGVPIGLINIIGDGLHELDAWISETMLFNAGVRMGAKTFYSILGMGAHPEKNHQRWSILAGLGGRIDLDPFWVEIDLVTHRLNEGWGWSGDDLDLLTKLRGRVGWQIAGQFAVWAGLSLNLLVSEARDRIAPSGLAVVRDSAQGGDLHLELAPGFLLGIGI